MTDKQKRAGNLVRARRKRAAVKVNRDWRNAVGILEDTPEAREGNRLGEEWRRSQSEP